MAVIATDQVYADIPSLRRVVLVPTDTAPKTAILDGGRPAVTQTGSGDYDGNAIKVTGPGGLDETIAGGRGGVGLLDLQATATYTGSFGFPVTGASSATAPGTTVYAVTSSNLITSLTLTAGSNTAYGKVDFFRGEYSNTDTVVKVGVTL